VEFNIADLFESLVEAIPNDEALVAGDRRLTFAELDGRANRLASFMKRRGVRAGDHVGLHLFNGPEYVEAMLAAFKLRAVGINLNYRYVAAELEAVCRDADLVMIISHGALADIALSATSGIDAVRTVVLVGDGTELAPYLARVEARAGARERNDVEARAGARERNARDVVDYEAAVADGDPAQAFEPRSGDDLLIIYTGGTTGVPKGVMWRHKDVFFAGLQGGNPGGPPLEAPEQLVERVRSGEGRLDVFCMAPFIHGAAMWTVLIAMFTGGKCIVLDGRSFDAKRACQLIAREQPNSLSLVGDAMALPLAEELAASPEQYDTSSVFVVSSAGAVLSDSVRERLTQAMPDAFIMNNFGSTEAGHQGYAAEDKGSDGRTSFGMDSTTSVLDEGHRPIAPGSGKIGMLARTGRLPIGYYNDPIKTAERFVEVDGVRWVLPGDLATIEEDGRITVLGRGTYCINSGGEKVFPEEVEEILKGHPDVYDALVVGVEDERWMQRVAAVVSPRAGKEPTLQELQTHCRKSLAGYKVPRTLRLVDAVLRMPSGKPDYAWARRQLVP
jgi:acyl-CoA synthetase (AMP-forming)/AMP-acid ligase II